MAEPVSALPPRHFGCDRTNDPITELSELDLVEPWRMADVGFNDTVITARPKTRSAFGIHVGIPAMSHQGIPSHFMRVGVAQRGDRGVAAREVCQVPQCQPRAPFLHIEIEGRSDEVTPRDVGPVHCGGSGDRSRVLPDRHTG